MNILITGGAGFIGSNLALRLTKQHNVKVLDNLKRKGSELNLDRLGAAGVSFFHGDIRNPGDLESIEDIDLIVECSAEPSVMAGVNSSPDYVVQSNLFGAYNCFEYARKHNARVVFLSTSRVFPVEKLNNLPLEKEDCRFVLADTKTEGVENKGITRDFSLAGYKSLYGATKISAEMLLEEYNATYGTEYIINRCSVIAGPWQMGKVDQGVFALWVAKHFYNKKLSYIGFGGEGHQVRDFLHIDDLCDLIEIQLSNWVGYKNDTYHVGGGYKNSASLRELTKLAQSITGNTIPISEIKETRPMDVKYFVIDNSQTIKKIKDWKPKRSLKVIAQDVHQWIQENEQILKNILS